MPAITPKSGGKLAKIGSVRSFVNVIRELSFDEIRDHANRSPRLLVVAPNLEASRTVARLATGVHDSHDVDLAVSGGITGGLSRYDGVIVVGSDAEREVNRLRALQGASSVPIVAASTSDMPTDEELERAREGIVAASTDRAISLGRTFPAFRPAAAAALIEETSRANAQFAFVSNLPSLVPVVGSMIAAGADILVLTKNQMLLVFKLAAVHGRELNNETRIFREMIPVAGAAPIWRTIAREAASFLPFAAGTVPKVAIAYAGTAAAGRAADFYYRFGQKPTRMQLREFYRSAAEAARRLPLPARGENADADRATDSAPPAAGGTTGA